VRARLGISALRLSAGRSAIPLETAFTTGGNPMTTDPVHPMVMKAARALAAYDGWDMPNPHAEHIHAAQAALTGCGALECLECLERVEQRWEKNGFGYNPDDRGSVQAVIAKARGLSSTGKPQSDDEAEGRVVYGSAPE